MTTYYTVSAVPASHSFGSSAYIRTEYTLIQTAFATVNTEMLTKGAIAGQAWAGTQNFTGATITVPTAAAADNTTLAASTAHVFAERTNAATLTNKTLTTPTINSPTGIVKGDVGLGNVDNTSDVNKPVSTATQTAIDTQIGTATQTALDAKGAITGQTWTGNHIFPTQVGTDSSTNAANMAAVQAALAAYIGTNLGLPTFTIANALQNLRIKSDGSGYEWASNTPPAGATIYNALNFGGF